MGVLWGASSCKTGVTLKWLQWWVCFWATKVEAGGERKKMGRTEVACVSRSRTTSVNVKSVPTFCLSSAAPLGSSVPQRMHLSPQLLCLLCGGRKQSSLHLCPCFSSLSLPAPFPSRVNNLLSGYDSPWSTNYQYWHSRLPLSKLHFARSAASVHIDDFGAQLAGVPRGGRGTERCWEGIASLEIPHLNWIRGLISIPTFVFVVVPSLNAWFSFHQERTSLCSSGWSQAQHPPASDTGTQNCRQTPLYLVANLPPASDTETPRLQTNTFVPSCKITL